jgi:hypothetical protein
MDGPSKCDAPVDVREAELKVGIIARDPRTGPIPEFTREMLCCAAGRDSTRSVFV